MERMAAADVTDISTDINMAISTATTMVMPDMVIIKFIDERMVGNAMSIHYSSGIPLISFLS